LSTPVIIIRGVYPDFQKK